MLMAVKNQFKVSCLSIKYAVMREMLNKTSFIMNILFMILNNASFLIQWVVLYSLKPNIGGYQIKEIVLLWGITAGSYGIAHFLFEKAFDLSDCINTGKLDSFIVQPKNILISIITSGIKTSALGDILYSYIMLIIYGITVKNFLLLSLFNIVGAIIVTSFSIVLCSLSFWFRKSDMIADTGNSLIVNFATYPDGIFKGFVKFMLFTFIPVGIVDYLPLKIIISFNLKYFLIVILFTIGITYFAFTLFYKGLKRYSSSNLMIARI